MAPADMSSSQQRPLRCLVTGFGPFQSETTVNSSYEIARLLDGVYLTKPSTFDTRPALSPNAAKSTDTPVIVSSYLHAVRTSYAEVMRIVPEIHAIPFDIIIHLGLWEGSKVINIERQACKKGYTVFVYCLQVFETSLTYGNSNDIDGRLPALPMGYNRKEDRGFGSGYEYFPEFLREDRINTAAVVKALKARGCGETFTKQLYEIRLHSNFSTCLQNMWPKISMLETTRAILSSSLP